MKRSYVCNKKDGKSSKDIEICQLLPNIGQLLTAQVAGLYSIMMVHYVLAIWCWITSFDENLYSLDKIDPSNSFSLTFILMFQIVSNVKGNLGITIHYTG